MWSCGVRLLITRPMYLVATASLESIIVVATPAMSILWNGSITVSDNEIYEDITLSAPVSTQDCVLTKGSLRFLSVVDVARIPLNLICGPRYNVTTSCKDTQQFFSHFLSAPRGGGTSSRWWRCATPDSPLGILVAVENHQPQGAVSRPCVTEVLFYASRHEQVIDRLPTSPVVIARDVVDRGQPYISVHAIALSSDPRVPVLEPTPPNTPTAEQGATEGVFLPLSASTSSEVINKLPVRKRRSVNDTFDEATERRKKARKKGGESIAAAAAVKTEGNLPSLKHRRTISISESQKVPLQTRPPSRSPSIASSRPTTVCAQTELAKRSSLSRMQSISRPPEEATTDTTNKEIISRLVMAGMRLHGLSQTKRRKSRASSTAPSPAMDGASEQHEVEKQRDEEYKLVYHQVFKATCFAFRQHMRLIPLQPHTEALRETVDSLLDIFYGDPLKAGLPSVADEFTPGGRKAFGSIKNPACSESVAALPAVGKPINHAG